VCPANTCVDADGDGLYGDGGGCIRNDCNDSDPSLGASCGGGAPDQQAAWGKLRVVDAKVPAPHAWPVIRLDANGLPLIGYRSGPVGQGDLTLLHCTAADCSTALRRALVADNDSGNNVSMQIGSDGHPVLAHLNLTDFYLETFDCTDSACTAGHNVVQDSAVGQFGFDTSLAILPDRRPVIAYWASGANDLFVVICADSACSGGTPRQLEHASDTGNAPSVFISAAGTPYIAYTNSSVDEARLYRCAVADCSSSVNKVILAPHAASLEGSSAILGADGNPLILVRHTDGTHALSLYQCTAADCSTGTAHDLYAPEGQISSASLALLPGGNPFIVFGETTPSTGYDLGLIDCQDPACTTRSVEKISGANTGEHPDVAIRPNGNPLVVYHDVGYGRLMLYDVDMSMVTVEPQATVVPTVTPQSTNTPTDTPQPTSTPTDTPQATSTSTDTSVPTETPPPSPTDVPTDPPAPISPP
jgi:hypothetical protein